MSTKKILLIDDSEVVLALASNALDQAGYQTRTVLFPSQAQGSLALIVAKYKPDLILSDIDMPFLKGNEIASITKSNPLWSDIKICFYSSEPVDKLQAYVKATKADGFVRKSNDLTVLLRKVKEVLEPVR